MHTQLPLIRQRRLVFLPVPVRMGVLALVAAGMLLPAQASSQNAPADTAAQALLKRLQAEIGEPHCTEDAQCRTVAVGAKACGGPSGYLAWSTRQGHPERIAKLAEQQRDAEQKQQQAGGMMSDCRVVPDPGARCESVKPSASGARSTGRCVLRPVRTGGPSAA